MVQPFSSLVPLGLGLLTLVAPLTACTSQTNLSQERSLQQTSSDRQRSQWETVGALPLPLESHQTVILGNFIYVLGGWNDSQGPYAEVFFAPLQADGEIEGWQDTAPMPLRLQHHAALVHDGAIYVVGGDNGFWEESRVSDQIFRAAPAADGSITVWEEVGQLPAPLTIHSVAKIDDQIYVLGGSNTFRPGTTMVDTVYTATIAADGTVGAFQTGRPLPSPIGWLTATALEGQIVTISGKTQFSPTQLTEEVWRAGVGDNSELLSFEEIGATTPRERHATVRIDDTLVVIAGGGSDGVLSRVDAVSIDPQEGLRWTELAPLPEPRYAHAAIAHEGDIYVSGGYLRYGSTETSRDIFRLSFR